MSSNKTDKYKTLLRELQTQRARLETQQKKMDLLNHKLQHAEQQLLIHRRAVDKYRENLIYASSAAFSREITAAITHELRQLLAAITAYAHTGLCAMETNNDMDTLKLSLQNIQALSLQTGNTLSAFRSRGAQKPTKPLLTNINALIEEIPVLLHADIEKYNIDVILDLAPELPYAPAIAVQLQQVLLNLAVNAIEASKETSGKKLLYIRSRLAGTNHIRVSVSDNGIGIDKRYGDNLFSSYFSTKEPGRGIGLSLCRMIIKAHGGHLDFNRRKTKGAEVYFTLPVGSTQ